jgi:DNA-binding LacI/PurR family transcriptional regulator/biotin operon repressor
MSKLVVLSAAAQVAAHLRTELLRGVWSGAMPGGDRLAAELGIGRDTVEAALRQLEEEGLLANQGRRRGRRIVAPSGDQATRRIRVAILPGDAADRRLDYMVELEHELMEAGHTAIYPPKSLAELGMNTGRVARMVAACEADAWLVIGASREVLEWFAARETPVFALFGRRRGLAIPSVGPDKPPALAAATRELIGLGHQRIVLLARRMRRLPQPGASEQAFLNELAAHGIETSSYHLPDWEESVDGFHERLESLFHVTRPTALIIDEVPLFVAVQQFFAGRTIRVPQDVSLICTDASQDFDWCRPTVAHIRWASRPVVRRIVRWVANVASGKADLRQTLTAAKFVRGGTMGPVGGGVSR